MCKRISSAFQPVRSSSPQYIGEYLHPRTLSCYDDDDYTPSPPTPLHQHRWNSASPKVFLPNSSTVSLPASAVLGLRGRSAKPIAAPTVAKTTDDACHKRSHSVGAGQNLTLNLAPRKSDSDFGRPTTTGCALNTSAKLTRNVTRNVSRLPSGLSRPILTRQRCRCVPFLPTKPQPCSTPATPSPPAPNRHLHLDTAFTRTGWAQRASQLATTFLLTFSPNISTVRGSVKKSRTSNTTS